MEDYHRERENYYRVREILKDQAKVKEAVKASRNDSLRRSTLQSHSRAPTMDEAEVGRCLCGAIQFKVEGDPIYRVICHCLNCKRTSGSTFHTASIYYRKQYTLLKPPVSRSDLNNLNLPSIICYQDFETQSGKPLYRRFCGVCGSKISAITPLNEEIISVPAGVMPQAGKEWKPDKEQFVVDKCDWVPELGDLAKMQRGPGSETVDALKEKI